MELVEGQELTAHVLAQQVPIVNHLDRDVAPGDTTFEEGTIKVPVYGEEVEVEKRARVREEVEIDKEQVTGTQQEYECRFLDAETQAFTRDQIAAAFVDDVEQWEV